MKSWRWAVWVGVLLIPGVAIYSCQEDGMIVSGDGDLPLVLPKPEENSPLLRRYLVRLKPGFSESLKGASAESFLLSRVSSREVPDARVEWVDSELYAVELAEGQDPESVIKRLNSSAEVVHVEKDPVAYALGVMNDPYLSQQWAHAVIHSEEAWAIGTGGSVTVAVIDTGIDLQHSDLRDNLWSAAGETPGNGQDDDGNGFVDDVHGWDFANGDAEPQADDSPHFHGTHVSGTVGAVGNNGVGIAGHSPQVRIMPLKFLKNNGYGNVSHAIQAVRYAIKNGARIISNSWGSAEYSQELARVVDEARQAGVLFVAAAGNGGYDGVGDNNDSMPNFPSNLKSDNVIAVAATDRSDRLTPFSNFGVQTVHLGAPGAEILSTANGGRYQNLSGTSMATPLVSGVAALVWAKKPSLTYLEVKKILFETVDRVAGLSGRVSTGGRINAGRAMQSVADGGGGPLPEPNPQPPVTDPVPPSDPSGVADSPLLMGQTQIRIQNPWLSVVLDYDVSGFSGAVGAYIEVSRPNTGFSNPNGDTPDPFRLTYRSIRGVRGRISFVPGQVFPGWGTYQLRVIPLAEGSVPAGRFSHPSVLILQPF